MYHEGMKTEGSNQREGTILVISKPFKFYIFQGGSLS